jgi:two-component system chemotaxis response regulator CheV
MSGIGNSVEQMTQAHLRNVQQLAVFYTGHNNIYAINIAKIKAFIITEEVTISDTPTDTDIVTGIATIRGEPVTLINLDIWLGHDALPIESYKLIIFCEFNGKQVGFLVKDMINIVEKTTDELKNSEEQNAKVTYTTYVDINGKSELCTVFNAEQLLVDIGWVNVGTTLLEKVVNTPVNSEKKILIAEDSAVAREVLQQFCIRARANYEIFVNGDELIKELQNIDPQTVGLVITDIEMPVIDGYQVTQYIKENAQYSHIPVIVNSSMTTEAVKGKMRSIGVDEFVAKGDIYALYEAVKYYIGLAS